MTWIVSTAHPVVQRHWFDECILYDVDSGNTHLVTPLAADVLLRLQTHPSSLEALIEYFSTGDASPVAHELAPDLSSILDDLARIDLVRWCP